MQHKKLFRSQRNKMLAGVCGGIAEFFDVDPTVIRVMWAIFCCLGGSGIPAYLICWVIMPIEYNVG